MNKGKPGFKSVSDTKTKDKVDPKNRKIDSYFNYSSVIGSKISKDFSESVMKNIERMEESYMNK